MPASKKNVASPTTKEEPGRGAWRREGQTAGTRKGGESDGRLHDL